jgi:L-glyceraldehyde 3-phosphate reductase
MSYLPSDQRYERMRYNRCGRSGLKLPALSLGLWQNFGDNAHADNAREICRTAFDLGITHFDLANNYGPPPGSAESLFGRILKTDFAGHRDELVISSKAGYWMHPGPYGEWGSRKYLLSSLDRSLERLSIDYVDIFYSHRFDPDTPLEETMGALDQAVRQGKALYVGISSYNAQRTREAVDTLRSLGTPCLIHQPSYSMINRWVEDDGLLETLDELGMGSIAFSPLAQGLLTDKYLQGVPEDSRAVQGKTLKDAHLSPDNLERVRALNEIARRRGQTLAQMAIAWVLREGRVTSALVGASRPQQVVDSVAALDNPDFSGEELAEIDRYAVEGGASTCGLRRRSIRRPAPAAPGPGIVNGSVAFEVDIILVGQGAGGGADPGTDHRTAHDATPRYRTGTGAHGGTHAGPAGGAFAGGGAAAGEPGYQHRDQ